MAYNVVYFSMRVGGKVLNALIQCVKMHEIDAIMVRSDEGTERLVPYLLIICLTLSLSSICKARMTTEKKV